MKIYLKDLLPKLQRFSNNLDNLTMLTNQHWVSIDNIHTSRVVFIFRENRDLIVSTNGVVEKAKWEFMGNNSILVDRPSGSFLYKHGFFDENILALKMDSNDEYAVFVNENKYDGELNSIDQVTNFLENEYINQFKKLPQRIEDVNLVFGANNTNKTISDIIKILVVGAILIAFMLLIE
jgi:hypothetical protein